MQNHATGLKSSSSLAVAASLWILHALILAPPCLLAAEPTAIFHVRDFGAVADGKTDSGPAIREAIGSAMAAGTSAEVVLDAGTYRVRPDARQTSCFPIRGAADLVVRGAGPETKILISDPATGGFSVGLGKHVTLRDFTVDYDPLPFCQGTIRAVDEKAGYFDLDIEAGFTTPDAENFVKAMEPYGKWGMIVDPATRRIKAGTPDHYMTPRWEHRGDRVWRFFTDQEHYRRNLRHMRVGDSYVHLARGFGGVVSAHGCDGIRIENIVIHASPGLAVGLVGNRGQIVVRKLEVRFAPETSRLLTTNADGVHCQQNRSGPAISECYFEGMADDAINIYAPPNVLLEIRSPTEWLVSPGCQIAPGDRLQVLDPGTGQIRGQVKAVDVKRERRAFLLTLEDPFDGAVAGADHRVADTLYNLDACGAGFRIERNHMNGNRRYGCLLRAGAGVVQDNIFEDTTGAGVVLTNEPDWPEGPVPWGITIRGNRFVRGGTCLGYADSRHGALTVRACRLGHGLAEAGSVRDLIIEDNDFVDNLGAAMFLGGAVNVTVSQNRIRATLQAESLRNTGAIEVERCRGVVLSRNSVTDPRPATTSAVTILPSVEAGEAGVRITGLKTDLSPNAKTVDDRRSN